MRVRVRILSEEETCSCSAPAPERKRSKKRRMKGGYGEKKKMKYNTKTKSFDAGPEIAINKVESGKWHHAHGHYYYVMRRDAHTRTEHRASYQKPRIKKQQQQQY